MYCDHDPDRGRFIAALRGGRLMTQATLATAAGLGSGTVKRAEAGRPLSKETAQALCSVFGLPPAGLAPSRPGIPTGEGAPEPFAAGAVSRAAECDASRAHVPEETADMAPRHASAPAARDRRRWTGASLAAGAVVAFVASVALQWLAWMPPSSPDWDFFYVLQAASQCALALSAGLGLAWCAVRSRQGRRRTALATLAVVSLAAVAWPPYCAVAVSNPLSNADFIRIHEGYARMAGVVALRHVMEPGWDPAQARWDAEVFYQHALRRFAPYLRTPGTLAAHRDDVRSCHDLWLHAREYPASCDDGRRLLYERDWTGLWKSLLGGSRWTPVDPGFVWSWGDYSDALAIFVEYMDRPYEERDREGALRAARDYAASRRDRQGPAG